MNLRLLLSVVVLSSSAASAQPKKNVLFLIADDLNCDLGCYGAPGMETPNIDALAARGVRFEHAYCQYPLCSPSRSSFLTGRRPNVTGVLTNPSAKTPMSPHFREKIPDTVTLPQHFKKNGWFSARVGKLYHYGVPNDIGTSSLDDFYSWDLCINPRGLDREIHNRIFTLKAGEFGGTVSWLAAPGQDAEHTDGISAREAVKLLERFKDRDEAFFLAVGFYRPHTPYVAPRRWFDLYPTDAITLPVLSADDQSRKPRPSYGSAKPEQAKMTEDQKREAIQAYHASTSFMDAQVGVVTSALERLGLAENTVVLFMSDHGYHLADHGLWQKLSLFERSARVPLIIALPDAQAKGQTATGTVELLDLYRTLSELCGLNPPEYVEGNSLVAMLEDPSRTVKEAAFTQVKRGLRGAGYSVRSGEWRYTEWITNTGEFPQLFDEEADPAESKNLAAEPEHAGTVAKLKGMLAQIRTTP
jgi:iduronate 2-sulfatase